MNEEQIVQKYNTRIAQCKHLKKLVAIQKEVTEADRKVNGLRRWDVILNNPKGEEQKQLIEEYREECRKRIDYEKRMYFACGKEAGGIPKDWNYNRYVEHMYSI